MPTSVNINEIRNKISIINTRSAEVNNQRSVNLGKKQATESQLQALLKTYKDKYGVVLTPETLETEIQTVVTKQEEEYNKLAGVIEAVNAGNYDLANQLLGIETKTEEVQQAQEQSSVVSEAVNETVQAETTLQNFQGVSSVPTEQANTVPQSVQQATQPVASPVAQPTQQVVSPVAQPVFQTTQPVSPVASPVVQSVSPVAQPTQQVVSPIAQSVSPVASPVAGFTPVTTGVVTPPVGVSAPKVESKPSYDFDTALSGTEFMENVNDTAKAPIAALEGFTKNGQVLTGLDIAPSPSEAQATNKPKSFSEILGGTQFVNNGGNF